MRSRKRWCALTRLRHLVVHTSQRRSHLVRQRPGDLYDDKTKEIVISLNTRPSFRDTTWNSDARTLRSRRKTNGQNACRRSRLQNVINGLTSSRPTVWARLETRSRVDPDRIERRPCACTIRFGIKGASQRSSVFSAASGGASSEGQAAPATADRCAPPWPSPTQVSRKLERLGVHHLDGTACQTLLK
jgi:hypothetical protein